MVSELAGVLKATGHEAEVVAIPFNWNPAGRITDHMLACRLLDLTTSCGETIDRIIAIKFPAYLAPHANKVIWLAHQHRAAYDGWYSGYSELRAEAKGAQLRSMIRNADLNAMAEAKHVYTISKNVSERLQRFCGVASVPLYHPPPNWRAFHTGEYEGFLLVPSRITGSKRQKLILQALERTKSPVQLRFIGPAEGPLAADRFRKMVAASPVADRVQWLGEVSEADKISAYANCRGVVFAPVDEDYGYVTLEAMLSSKPVVTCTDSGGPLEFLRHNETGIICAPDPSEIAEALERLWNDVGFAARLGKAGREAYDAAEIGWERPLECLLA